jgi:cell division protein FtsI/penicillin-binding protein 2
MTLRGRRPAPGAPQRVARWRVAALSTVWILCLVLLLGRMVDLQVIRAGALARLALRQQIESVEIPGRRGLIVDRAGRPLAVNVEAASVYAVPRAISDPTAFAERLGPVLGLTWSEVKARLGRGGPQFAWLARRVPQTTARAVQALGLGDAVGLLQESRRAYPGAELASGVIGFTGVDDHGLAGLELEYDRVLRGTEGRGVADRDAIGRELVQTLRILTPPHDGDTLVLTLDEVIQHIAERELARALEQAGAPDGTVIVMDPRTGGILAMASFPTFDLNRYQTAPESLWKSPAVADVYEPGSTFKLILAAAALATHAVTPQDTFSDPGWIRINGFTIHDAEAPAHADALTLSDIVKYSSNVGAAQVATRLGKSRFYAYIRRFGLGRPTGIDLPGEAAGIVRPVSRWLGPSLQNIAFGQGISVTPLQLLVAASALATHGLEVRPHLVEAIRDPTGHTVATPGDVPPRQVIAPDVADRVLGMMRRVVEGGTGQEAQIDGYAVAGKTGTAERPSPLGGYQPDAYMASFVGVVPADAPRIAVLVIVDRPHGVYFGGEVAAPVFRRIARQVLWYLRVPPVPPSATPPVERAPRSGESPSPRLPVEHGAYEQGAGTGIVLV